MKYTVVWSQAVENLLAEIWLVCDDRNEVTRAMDVIERRLRQDPLTAGESSGGTTRILFEHPIVVQFDVYEDDRLVDLVDIRLISGRR